MVVLRVDRSVAKWVAEMAVLMVDPTEKTMAAWTAAHSADWTVVPKADLLVAAMAEPKAAWKAVLWDEHLAAQMVVRMVVRMAEDSADSKVVPKVLPLD